MWPCFPYHLMAEQHFCLSFRCAAGIFLSATGVADSDVETPRFLWRDAWIQIWWPLAKWYRNVDNVMMIHGTFLSVSEMIVKCKPFGRIRLSFCGSAPRPPLPVSLPQKKNPDDWTTLEHKDFFSWKKKMLVTIRSQQGKSLKLLV